MPVYAEALVAGVLADESRAHAGPTDRWRLVDRGRYVPHAVDVVADQSAGIEPFEDAVPAQLPKPDVDLEQLFAQLQEPVELIPVEPGVPQARARAAPHADLDAPALRVVASLLAIPMPQGQNMGSDRTTSDVDGRRAPLNPCSKT